MSSVSVKIDLPEETLGDPDIAPEDVPRTIQLLWVVDAVRRGHLTAPRAAEIAGMPRLAFYELMAVHRVYPIDHDAAEMARELEAVERLGGPSVVIAVVNTGPLICLTALGRLELLPALFPGVLVPHEVQQELRASLPQLPAMTFLPQSAPRTAQIAREDRLDIGEAAVLAVGLEYAANWPILDEKRGRRCAARRGFSVVGTLGMLLRAKRSGLLDEVAPSIRVLLDGRIQWMSLDLANEVLVAAGEPRLVP